MRDDVPILPAWLPAAREGAQTLSQIVVAVGAVGYIAGIIIVNMNLLDYGVAGTDLLRAEYVTAGVSWLALTVVTYLVLWFAVEWPLVALAGSGSRTFRVVRAIWVAAFPCVLGLLLLVDLAHRKPYLVVQLLIVLCFNAAVLVPEEDLKKGLSLLWSSKRPARDLRSTLILSTLMKVGQAFVGIVLYSAVVFPVLPAALGGGDRGKARFVIQADQVSTVQLLGLEVNPNTRSTEPVRIILETPESFVVVLERNAPAAGAARSIQLMKHLIDGSILASPK